ncbi:MAG: tetratricopeptide repeat protein [Candidatus Aegiribacteria sp.]|nr:tetratricopeptide repeat protein [Candidatus Aegiribacteria sp.]
MIVTGRISWGFTALIAATLLMFGVPAAIADEGGDILVLVGGMEGPDPDVYPVSETVIRWMQSILESEGNIELRLHDRVVPIEEFSAFYSEAYAAGAEEIVIGLYEIEGSNVSLRIGSTHILSDDAGTDLEMHIDDDDEVIRFSVDLLNDQSSPPDRIRYFTHFLAASVYWDSGQLDRAMVEINYAIEAAVTMPVEVLSGLYSYRGLLQGKEFNNHHAALADFNTALELDSTNYKALSNRAYALTLLGRYEEAFDDYNTKVETFPDSADAYYDRAGFLTDEGYFEEALADYQIAIELAPDNPQYLYDSGLCCTYMGNFDNAIQVFSNIIDEHPYYLDAYMDRALIYITQDEIETAHEGLLQALEINDSYSRIYNGLILTAAHLDQWEDALEYAKRGMELDPTDENFYKVAGGAYLRMDDFDSALYEFERTYEVIMTFHNGIDPQGSPLQNIVDLIDELREISEMDPSSSEYFYARGCQFSGFYEFEKAVEEFSEAVRLDPDFEDAYYMRGLCCMKTGDTQQAMADMETVIGMTTIPSRKRIAEQNLQYLSD